MVSQYQDHVLPINPIDCSGSFHFHELIAGHEFLFKQTVRTVVKRKHMHYSKVARHDYKYITVQRLTVEAFTYDGQHTAVLATHIREITDIIEMVQIGNAQHKPSRFSTMRTNSQ